ncbi:MAG: iron-sulfur cluster assembly accessory protein [Planctomycetes bacterium]|nr:iron-sulfur cluster assembly accessory protein [Planctomycetota bacterium]
MSVATAEPQELKIADRTPPTPSEAPIHVSERAARAVQQIVDDQRLKCLAEFAPELVEPFKAFGAKHGRGPTLDELAAANGLSEQDLLVKIGTAAYGKPDHMPQELREMHRELAAANGHPPTIAELAARAGVSETEALAKIGRAAGTILTKVFLRLRVVGGGCSGLQHKLDLDPISNPKADEHYEIHGVSVAIDKRSALYVVGVNIDYHDDLNRRGFSVSNLKAKTTCGCGSSFSM